MKHSDVVLARPYRLVNQIQHYAWGTKGAEAFIPRFLGIEAEDDVPYAELWIGAHPKAPSSACLNGTRVSLRRWIAHHPQATLGKAVADKFAESLPFLFKVLSAADALSIQAHPSKAQAEVLHARDPEHYPDANHKPEVAIALKSLAALVGFKPFDEIAATLETYPELAHFIGHNLVAQVTENVTAASKDKMRALYARLVKHTTSQPDQLLDALTHLDARLRSADTPLNEIEQRFLKLRQKYTGADVGLFSIFLLNLVHLQKGQGLFIDAGIPHAYLEGNIVECMANSDNVVRAGLTPKYRDVETLLNILTYETGPVTILDAVPSTEEVIYKTPAPEFRLSRWTLTKGQTRHEVTNGGPEVLLVTKGCVSLHWQDESATFEKGNALFIPACLAAFDIQAQGAAECFRVDVPV